MRKPLLLTIFMWMSAQVFAGPVGLEQASLNARRFVKEKAPALARGKNNTRELTMTVACQTDAYYVFNLGDAQGYVIASGDDRTPEVLGYADKGSFDSENIPENMKAWLQSYADQMLLTTATPTTTSDMGRPISPMINTQWGQDSPYFNKCPELLGKHCVTGCVATAMAQVMSYHRYPAQTIQEIPAFTTNSAQIEMETVPVTTIDWNNIADNYSASTTEEQKDAVATLMFLCGASVLMDYTNNASGAASMAVAQALRHYFGYSNTTRNVRRNDYSAEEWDRLIYTEILSGRPVVYGGRSSAGGHEFVIDGYDGNGYFHVNWGWKGKDDGYFLLSALSPNNNNGIGASGSADGYNMSQDANIGIQPKGLTETTVLADLLDVTTFTPMMDSYDRLAKGMDFCTYLQYSVSNFCHAGSFDFGVLIYNTDYELVEAGLLFNADYKYCSGYTGTYSAIFGQSLSDGQYYMVAGNRPAGKTEWLTCENAWRKGILVTINGKKMTLCRQEIPDPNQQVNDPGQGGTEQPVVMLSGQLTIDGQLYKGGKVALHAIITNYGTDYDDHLYMMLDGQLAGSADFRLKAGETAEWLTDLENIQAGEHKMTITTDSEGKNMVAEGEFAVALYPEAILEMKVNATNVENGRTEENRISLRVDIMNTGTETYDNSVLIELYSLTAPGKTLYTEEKACHLDTGGTVSLEFNCEDLDFDQSYYIRALYRSGNDWVRATQTENIHVRKPEVAMQITMFTVEDMLINGILEEGEEIELQFIVRNEGNMSSGKLYIWENESLPTALDVKIQPGAIGICKYKFTANKPGVFNFRVTHDAEGEDVAFNQNIIISNNMERSLDVDLLVNGIYLDDDGTYVLENNTVTLDISIENSNPEMYDDIVLVSLYQTLTDINDQWGDQIANDSIICKLEPNKSETAKVSFGNLKDGEEYFFIVYYRSRNEWVRADASDAFVVWLEDKMNGHNFQLADDVTADGDMQVGSPITMHIPLYNKGTERTGTIYYQTTGKDKNVKALDVDIEPGGTAIYDVVFYPEETGTTWFYIASSKYKHEYWAEDDWVESYYLEIDPEPQPDLDVDFQVNNLIENELKDESISFGITISNTGDYPFNREGAVCIREEATPENNYADRNITQNSILCQLEPSQSETWDYSFDELEDGKQYYIAYYYWWMESWVLGAYSPTFKVNKFKPITKFDIDEVVFSGSLFAYHPVNTEITITNRGNVKDGIIYVFVDDMLLSLTRISGLEPEQTAKYIAQFTPRSAGTKTVKISSDAEGKEVLATRELIIGEEDTEAHLTGEVQYENADMNTLVVSDSWLSLLVNVTNADGTDYTGELKAVLTTEAEKEHSYGKPLKLEAGKNRSISFVIGDLTYHVPYTITVYYTSLGHDKQLADPVTLTLRGNVNGIETPQSEIDGIVEVYNTSGILIGRMRQDEVQDRLDTLPKGIYIVRQRRSAPHIIFSRKVLK